MSYRAMKAALLMGAACTSGVAASDALAQQASDEGSAGDIIVTARRTEERLQDVPISITVFNQEQLSRRNIVTPGDLASFTPSLAANERFGPEKSTFAIRGFVQESTTQPSVGVYFADVVAPRAQGGTTAGNTAVAGSFMDLENVQVLKGPQGTLFGRNTTGGAVLLVPKKPTDRLEGYVEGSVGDYDMRRLQGVLNVPLAETFKIRLALDRNQRDGYMINHSGIGPRDFNNLNYFAGRLSIVAELTPEFETYTIATYSHSDTHGYGAHLVACDRSLWRAPGEPALVVPPPPAPLSVTPITRAVTAPSACDQIDRQNARGDGPYDVEQNNPTAGMDLKHWQVINTTTWSASDTLTVKNIVSYQELRERSSFTLMGDNFFVSDPAAVLSNYRLPALPVGARYQHFLISYAGAGYNVAQSTFTEELQLQGRSADASFDWQTGAYFEVSKPLGFSGNNVSVFTHCTDPANLVCTNPIFVGAISATRIKTEFNNKGFYAQGTYRFTDQLSLTGGIRYTIDKIVGLSENYRISLPSTITCADALRFFTGAPGTPKVVASPSQCRFVIPKKSEKPTWLIDIDYKPTPDILLYAKYARGYRQGGINMSNVGLETWEPEKVDAYEIGAKTSFRGVVSGYFNLAAFYNDFTNQQINSNARSLPGFSAQPVINAGRSRIQGIEVDASVNLFDDLRLDVGYTYLDTKLLSLTVPPIPQGAPYLELIPTAVEGGQLALSPKNRVSITATYTLPLEKHIGRISVGGTFVHTDDQAFAEATIDPYKRLPASDILNLNVNWNTVMGQPIDLAFFMTNVTDAVVPVAVGLIWNSGGYENQLYAPPRMWGFRLRYNFGQ